MAVNGIPAEFRSLKRDRAFWDRVDVRSDNECWLWKSDVQLTQAGYGTAFYGPFHTTAHRIAYMLRKGLISDGAQILHNCEDRYPRGSHVGRRCCNPDHLYPGSPQDNSDDMKRTGRWLRLTSFAEDRNPNSRLSKEQMPQFFEDAAIMSQRQMAAKYGISKSQVGNILRGESRPSARAALPRKQRDDVDAAKERRVKRLTT